MPINIGNSSLREVYAGSTAIKKIYAGSNLVWSKSSGSSLILTLDTSNVTQDLQRTDWYIQVEVYSRSIDDYKYISIYFDETKEVDEGCLKYHFSDNQFIYSDISDGDEVWFWFCSDSGEEPDIHIECNGEDIYNGPVFTIDGQTTVALVVTDNITDNVRKYNEISLSVGGDAAAAVFEDEDCLGAHLECSVKTNKGSYVEGYNQEDYDTGMIMYFVTKNNVDSYDIEYPISGTWTMEYYKDFGDELIYYDLSGTIEFTLYEDEEKCVYAGALT